MRRTIFCLLALGGFVCVDSDTAHAGAEPAALSVAYGNGVHAYYDGDFQTSYDEFSGVIEAGGNDSRAYYFRGLAALKLGRTDEAEADFQQGANLEAEGRGSHGSRAISLALERVQGCDRLKLEQYRGRARVAALQRDRAATRQRYSDIEDAEADVLRRRRPERREPAERVAAPTPKAAAADDAAEPAAEEDAEMPRAERTEPEEPAEPEEPEEPADKPADTANPFADEPAER